MRKARLLLITVDPSRISNAIAGLVSSIYPIRINAFSALCKIPVFSILRSVTILITGWVAVLAVLRIQFAKAITLGSAIGESLRKPASRFLAPAMKQVRGVNNGP